MIPCMRLGHGASSNAVSRFVCNSLFAGVCDDGGQPPDDVKPAAEAWAAQAGLRRPRPGLCEGEGSDLFPGRLTACSTACFPLLLAMGADEGEGLGSLLWAVGLQASQQHCFCSLAAQTLICRCHLTYKVHAAELRGGTDSHKESPSAQNEAASVETQLGTCILADA